MWEVSKTNAINLRSGLHAIVQEHVWDQLFTVDTIWNIGETGDINTQGDKDCPKHILVTTPLATLTMNFIEKC